MKISATYHVCQECRDIIVNGYQSENEILNNLTIDVEDEGFECMNACDICESQESPILYVATEYKFI